MNSIKHSNHAMGFWFTVMFPIAAAMLIIALDAVEATVSKTRLLSPLTSFYACTAMWWIFAFIAAINPEDQKSDCPRYVGWLLLLPTAAIIISYATPIDGYDARIFWFNSLVVTWIGFIIWILIDWYRWKYNPSERQQAIIFRRTQYANRRAEIDAIPDCVVPSNLNYSPTTE